MIFADGLSALTHRPTRYPQSLITIAILAVFLFRCPTPAASQATQDLFVPLEVATGAATHQTVLTGDLLGGPTADLIVVSVDENYDRHVRVYELQQDSFTLALESPLRPGVLFVDLANIAGHNRMITYEPGRLSWFDPDSEIERPLLEVVTGYRTSNRGQVPHVDITRDLNRDGHDDVIIPDVDGFWISVQESDGSFTQATRFGPPEPFAEHPIGNLDVDESVRESSPTYGDLGITAMTLPVYLSRVHEMDYDLDGHSDLVFWNEDHFDIYLQDPRGRFSKEPQILDPGVPIDSDGAYSRAFDYTEQGVMSLLLGLGKKSKRTVLHSLRDMNGDGIADLVTLTLSGRTITRQRSAYEVRFGTPTPDGVRFSQSPSSTIQAGGRAGAMQTWGYASQWFEDLDGDDQIEIVMRDVRVGFGGMSRALLGNSVPIDLEFYRTHNGLYPRKPSTTRKIRRFAPLDGLGNVFFPPVLMGDVNGDGLFDLLVGQSPKELHVFLGVSRPDLLERRPQKVAVDLPRNERNSWLVDVDRNGKQDLLMHHTPTGDSPTETHRVTLLIAR